MFQSSFTSMSASNLDEAKEFYTHILGLEVTSEDMTLQLALPGNSGALSIYSKENHEPATFTVVNFVVADIDAAYDALKNKGVTFEQYDDLGGGAIPDEKGILRGKEAQIGPNIAWFKDPAGNILSIVEE